MLAPVAGGLDPRQAPLSPFAQGARPHRPALRQQLRQLEEEVERAPATASAAKPPHAGYARGDRLMSYVLNDLSIRRPGLGRAISCGPACHLACHAWFRLWHPLRVRNLGGL